MPHIFFFDRDEPTRGAGNCEAATVSPAEMLCLTKGNSRHRFDPVRIIRRTGGILKRILTLLISAATGVLILGCGITKEVDYATGKETTADLPAYFGPGFYLPDIETFMQIGWAGTPDVSPDGRRVFFTTGLTGVTQLYLLNDRGWPYQLTTFNDGIDWYALSRSGDLAIIGASIGGSEQAQLYLLDTRTGRCKQLTDYPDKQFGSIVWSRDDRTIYYRSNVDNGRDFKLYKMDLASGRSDKLVDGEGWNGWGDLSLDGSKLIYFHSSSSVNTDLYLVDVATGRVEHLTPHEGDVLYSGGFFSADGAKILITSNDNELGISLRAILDVGSKDITFMDPDSRWEVDAMNLSPDRTVMAWTLNEDGYARLKLADIITGHDLPTPEINGLIGGMAFSGKSQMVFTFNSAAQTSDVWRWDWKARQLDQLTFATYAGVDPDIFTEPELIKYISFDGLEVPAFLYLPPGYKEGPIPFILDMHGGPESQFRPSFNRHFQYLLLHGYGIFAPNVRGSDGYGRKYLAMDDYKNRMNSVKDMKAGVEWLIAGGYTEPRLVGVKGASYGGYMTMAAVTEYPDLFGAAINSVGIVNFVSFLQNTSAYRQRLREAEYGPLTDLEFLKSISPLYKADRITTPLMVVHGENDPRVPISEARQIIAVIQEKGGLVEPLIFPDEGHGVEKLQNRLVFYRKMVEFFDKHLKRD